MQQRDVATAPRGFLGLECPVVLAHRGFDCRGSDGGIENTFEAFQAAVDLGAQCLETDVHATSDGVVLAFHDDVLDRVSTGSGALRDRTFAELADIRVSGQPLCRLDHLLASFPDVRFNIDVKSKDVIAPLVKVLVEAERRQPGTIRRICLASFSDRRLRSTLRRLPGHVVSSAGTLRTGLFWLGSRRRGLDWISRAAAQGVDALQVPIRHAGVNILDRRFVSTAHRHGVVVHVWTVNDATTMREMLQLGVDGIVTDRADIALPIVQEHRLTHNPPPQDLGGPTS